ncbi:MAG: ArsR family transcriptional regulator [Candidatus Aenigmarchaeota archaeon]|nr:ArsR family transcriptional regulator [Candidatus Aenigmarchaeota archaeon]
MLIPTKNILKRTLMLNIAGTRGGLVRLRILLLIKDRPHNTNELSRMLSMDYKSVQHHMRLLEKASLIMSSKKTYDNEYKLSTLLEANIDILKDLENMEKVNKGIW